MASFYGEGDYELTASVKPKYALTKDQWDEMTATAQKDYFIGFSKYLPPQRPTTITDREKLIELSSRVNATKGKVAIRVLGKLDLIRLVQRRACNLCRNCFGHETNALFFSLRVFHINICLCQHSVFTVFCDGKFGIWDGVFRICEGVHI